MKIYICNTDLTLEKDAQAEEFYNCMIDGIKEYIEYIEIMNEPMLLRIIPDVDNTSLLIFFNNFRQSYSDKFKRLLKRAIECNSFIWPVALTLDSRMPCETAGKYQSFDVASFLENRLLTNDNMKTAAQIFARKIVSMYCPTCYTENKLLFVSHRRLDGEGLTAKLCDKINLLERNKRTFRDVVEVKVGEEAQEVIESALLESDVLIYLHTPLSVQSKWIEKEIRMAILYDIPILWIRIDNAGIDGMSIIPGAEPHFDCSSTDFQDEIKLERIVNQIEELCFRIIMGHSDVLFDYRNAFDEWAKKRSIQFENIDKTMQVYKLTCQNEMDGIYPRRAYTQFVQYFSRTIKENDIKQFEEYLNKEVDSDGYVKYDSAVLLSGRNSEKGISERILKKGFAEHNYIWKRMIGENMSRNGGKIIISGAFPDSEHELYKQPLIEAVKIFSQEIIMNGYTLVFGSHPTFQKIIFAVAEEFSSNPQETLEMYISKHYKDEYDIAELLNHAKVHEIDKEQDRNTSLTKMRKEMLQAGNVCAVICLGGKIKKNNPAEQGVDEEIKLARQLNIPVFLVGTVGGRSSEKALELKANGDWSEINSEPKELNEKFLYDVDYRKLVNELIKN